MDIKGKERILNVFNKGLQNLTIFILLISIIALFCNLDTVLGEGGLPQKIIPYFGIEWIFSKYAVFTDFKLVLLVCILIAKMLEYSLEDSLLRCMPF